MRFGLPEIIIVVVLLLLLFGAKRIPELMRGLGRGAREFKEGMRGDDPKDSKSEDETKR